MCGLAFFVVEAAAADDAVELAELAWLETLAATEETEEETDAANEDTLAAVGEALLPPVVDTPKDEVVAAAAEEADDGGAVLNAAEEAVEVQRPLIACKILESTHIQIIIQLFDAIFEFQKGECEL